jgi:hypothetical protein
MHDPISGVSKMPIKKRTMRVPETESKYVYTDQGVLVVRTPAECTKWDNEFRIRIVRDYVPPRTLMLERDYTAKHVEGEKQERTYLVADHKLQVNHPTSPLSDVGKVIVLRTDILDLTAGKRLFLYHSDPAMRILMIYSFIKSVKIGGVPKLDIAEIDTRC